MPISKLAEVGAHSGLGCIYMYNIHGCLSSLPVDRNLHPKVLLAARYNGSLIMSRPGNRPVRVMEPQYVQAAFSVERTTFYNYILVAGWRSMIVAECADWAWGRPSP